MKNQLFGTYSLIALSVPVALFAIAPDAQAIGIIQGSTATSALTGGIGNITNITNQSGLSATYTSGVTDFDSFVADTTHSPSPANDFVFEGSSGVITFDLGASYTLDSLALWQNFLGVRGFNLYADTDADTGSLGTSLGSFNAVDSSYASVFKFSATPTQFIQMEITSNTGSNITVLGEVAFAQPVPWETDALPVIGSALFFAGGVWAKRKLAKPLDKE
jgi:hypothetical protein